MHQHYDEQPNNGTHYLQDLARDMAAEVGIILTEVHFDDGRLLGCRDFHLLTMEAAGKTVSTKIRHEEVGAAAGRRTGTDLTREKIRNAIERLQIMLG